MNEMFLTHGSLQWRRKIKSLLVGCGWKLNGFQESNNNNWNNVMSNERMKIV